MPTETTTPPSSRRPWYRRPSGWAAAAAVTGSFVLWGYAFSGFARKDPPDTLADLGYRASAEQTCAPFRARVDELPPAPAARTPQERAGVLGTANDILAGMVVALRGLEPDNDADRAIVVKWLADWDTYVDDRRAYAAVLATGTDALFTLTSPDGEIYTKSMDNLATVNDMPSCGTPGDV